MSAKYRIKVVRSGNGDRFRVQRRGLLWGWNNVNYKLSADGRNVLHCPVSHHERSLNNAKRVVDWLVARDNEFTEVIDYP